MSQSGNIGGWLKAQMVSCFYHWSPERGHENERCFLFCCCLDELTSCLFLIIDLAFLTPGVTPSAHVQRVNPERSACKRTLFICTSSYAPRLPPPPKLMDCFSSLGCTSSSSSLSLLFLTFDPSRPAEPGLPGISLALVPSGHNGDLQTKTNKKILERSAKNLPPCCEKTSAPPHSTPSPLRPPGGAALTSQYYNNSDKKRQPCTLLLNAVHW